MQAKWIGLIVVGAALIVVIIVLNNSAMKMAARIETPPLEKTSLVVATTEDALYHRPECVKIAGDTLHLTVEQARRQYFKPCPTCIGGTEN